MTLQDIEYRVFYRPHDNPLETFYLPTLAESIQYDRSAGYFRSSALAAAAAGIVRLIENGGRMRLLVGAELSEADVQAIREGYELRQRVEEHLVAQLPDLGSGILRERLEALTWMVANERLDIKVVLPLDQYGRPVPAPEASQYYHTKKGIFTDGMGNQVGFSGSVNESAQAWHRNFEEFTVVKSWGQPYEREVLGDLRASFQSLWEGHDPYWLAMDLPEAVQERMVAFAPDQPPTHDPLEPRVKGVTFGDDKEGYVAAGERERLLFQFLRDAPYLPDARDLGVVTGNVEPWPHQQRVAHTLLDHFPDRALLADEVGLGKTIEAGVVIRQLILSGRVRRCLILTPAAVLKQWQEELYEKFNLDILRYDRRQLLDVEGEPLDGLVSNPWDRADLLLASSHLARRRGRVEQLVRAQPWDLIVVDEAHHARRKDFREDRYRPNRLLTLLNGLKVNNRYKSLLLLTATPMQVHPVEVWDLLMVLGLGGYWGVDADNFLRFFAELRQPFASTDWDFVFDMVADHLEDEKQVDPNFRKVMRDRLGPAHANVILSLPWKKGKRREILRQLPSKTHTYVSEMARRHTPLQRYLFRNTRELLREYVEQGILQANVPRRQPEIRRIPFEEDEAELYNRITEYISKFYTRYQDQRTGLGFIMTVYRRRLTSSFAAICRSLERRRELLRGVLDPAEALTFEDEVDLAELEEEEADAVAEAIHEFFGDEPLTPAQLEQFQDELRYLDNFIGALRNLSHADSKVGQLKNDLDQIFRERQRVLVFTQYTDTMDYLRGQLQPVYGSRVACYSGRGGEVWNGIAWVPAPKEEVKNRFLREDINILLCTESASEGLNLQKCGVLINYDMPWNPMRVEQRIGRIDRIGQEYDVVWIYNYFYRDTIEDRIYQALKDRINWFELVVGELQPILADVNKMTRDLAMLSAEQQAEALPEAIRRLRAAIDEAQTETLDLSQYLDQGRPDQYLHAPVTLSALEQMLTSSSATGRFFQPHPNIEDAYRFAWRGTDYDVTFSPAAFDQFPSSLRFLSYGEPLLEGLLASIPEPEAYPAALTRFATEEGLPLRSWYALDGGKPRLLTTLDALQNQLEQPAGEIPDAQQEAPLTEARNAFQQQVEAIRREYQARLAQYTARQRDLLQARARRLLEKAALVEIALGQQPKLFEEETYPLSFNEAAVVGLRRHKSPWTWLLVAATNEGKTTLPIPQERDAFYQEIQGHDRAELKKLFAQLDAEARDVTEAWRAAKG